MGVSRRGYQVAVLVEYSRAYGRGLIEGIVRYAREQGNWQLYSEPRGLEGPPSWLCTWQGDGILARFSSRTVAESVRAIGLPLVDLYGTLRGTPHAAGDNPAIARLAFEHLWERGFRRFAFCGLMPGRNRYIDERQACFCQQVAEAGYTCSVFATHIRDLTVSDWESESQRLGAWLRQLAHPVGIFTSYDEVACFLLYACQRIGLRVPEDVAVLGAGNDPVLCELSQPPLSSIDLDPVRIGYLAAAMLDQWLRRRREPKDVIRVPPRRVVVRRSTDVLAVEDPKVAAGLQWLREHLSEGVRIPDLARHLCVSVSVLERKFAQVLGRSPKAALLRMQMERARELLVESDLPLKVIARRCGFHSEKYFCDIFYHYHGLRPAAYRREHGR